MKNILALLAFLTLSGPSLFAQYTLKETNGRPIAEVKYENLIGDANLHPQMKNARVRFKNGKNAVMPVNIDLISKTAFFSGEKNEKLGFVDQVISIEFLDSLPGQPSIKLYHIDGDYFHVLAEGKISLYKKVWKDIWQEREYNAASVSKTVVDKSAYFILNPTNTLVPVKNNKSFITALPDQKQKLEQYVKTEKINFKTDADLKKVIDYYNTL
ncbi:hypothetical protein IWX76_001514 [Pedobacter sp. CAN_A7]|uniref:hypothetical protein n=1 Tax=Pedobacter sp. CAN_A7 TaxID=2787722 RepID=UPI0018CBC10B